MIKAGLLADDAVLQRFQNEAEAVALLDHPGIVPVYEVGDHEGQRYFSMKLVEGNNLAEELASFQDNPRAAATLLAETAEAVYHAHMRGILHHAILKPANSHSRHAEGHPHVTGFPAWPSGSRGCRDRRRAAHVLGTPAYMSPEQANARRGSITTATDVYGLGASSCPMLTGKAPFGGDSVIDTLDAVRTRPPESPRTLNANTPRDLETICLKCLEKDPRRRYASAHELAADLNNWLESRPITARRVGAAERAWLLFKRKPVVAVLAASVVLATVIGTAAVIAVQAKANAETCESTNTSCYDTAARRRSEDPRGPGDRRREEVPRRRRQRARAEEFWWPKTWRLLKEPLAFFHPSRPPQADRDTRPDR